MDRWDEQLADEIAQPIDHRQYTKGNGHEQRRNKHAKGNDVASIGRSDCHGDKAKCQRGPEHLLNRKFAVHRNGGWSRSWFESRKLKSPEGDRGVCRARPVSKTCLGGPIS